MKINYIDNKKEILDLEEKFNVDLIANEHLKKNGEIEFRVAFKNCEIRHGGILTAIYGCGKTVDDALSDYATQLTNQEIVFNAHTNNRKSFTLQKVIHTKLLNK